MDHRISLSALTSILVDASLRGLFEIRRVHDEQVQGGSESDSQREGGRRIAASMKVEGDARSMLTEADLAAQKAIIAALASTPAIQAARIVGEEDGSAGCSAAEMEQAAKGPALRDNLLKQLGGNEATVAVDELTVFVDPVDGTREFVEGRLGAVQTLVGVARRGRAIAGAIGLPFPADGSAPCVVYGIVGEEGGSGVVGEDGQERQGGVPLHAQRLGDASTVNLTGDSKNATLAAARDCLAASLGEDSVRHEIQGGAGNKMLCVAAERADFALMHFGTSLWDTCAPEAVVRATGGHVSDLFGAPLVHDADAPGGLVNALGVIASGSGRRGDHDKVCEAMREDARILKLLDGAYGDAEVRNGIAQSADVARSLEGAPLDRDWMERAVLGSVMPGQETAYKLVGYSAPEKGSVRGLMSDACRLDFDWQPTTASPSPSVPSPPASAFYKRIVMGDLEHARLKARTAPLKLARDTKSYGVEASFLGSAACEALVESGVPVARAYAVDLRPCEHDPIESRFGLLLQEFRESDGWSQSWLLDERQAHAALAGLAKMHAYFWENSAFWRTASQETQDELTSSVWPSGAYWQPSMQPAEQLTTLVAEHWPMHCENFAEAFAKSPMLEGVEIATIGERLQRIAAEVGAEAHPFGSTGNGVGCKCLIHGDPKQGNVFFRDEDDGTVGVGFIDFQWCGFGLAATDVAHHIVAALRIECLSADGSKEEALLDHYHTCLMESFVRYGAADNIDAARLLLPRDVLSQQYESAVLDMCRCVFAYQWARVKASPTTLAANRKSLGRNSYNKSVDHACWLVRQADNMLRKREARTA